MEFEGQFTTALIQAEPICFQPPLFPLVTRQHFKLWGEVNLCSEVLREGDPLSQLGPAVRKGPKNHINCVQSLVSPLVIMCIIYCDI